MPLLLLVLPLPLLLPLSLLLLPLLLSPLLVPTLMLEGRGPSEGPACFHRQRVLELVQHRQCCQPPCVLQCAIGPGVPLSGSPLRPRLVPQKHQHVRLAASQHVRPAAQPKNLQRRGQHAPAPGRMRQPRRRQLSVALAH